MSTTRGAFTAGSSGHNVISVWDVLCALQWSGASKLSDIADKNCWANKWIAVLHCLWRKHVQKSFGWASTEEGGVQTGDSSPKLGKSISVSSLLDETVPQPLSKATTTNFLLGSTYQAQIWCMVLLQSSWSQHPGEHSEKTMPRCWYLWVQNKPFTESYKCNYCIRSNLWNVLIIGTSNFSYLIRSNSWNKWIFEINNHSNRSNGQLLLSFIFSCYNNVSHSYYQFLPMDRYVAGNLQSAWNKWKAPSPSSHFALREPENARVSGWIL